MTSKKLKLYSIDILYNKILEVYVQYTKLILSLQQADTKLKSEIQYEACLCILKANFQSETIFYIMTSIVDLQIFSAFSE